MSVSIGERIEFFRTEAGLSKSELARLVEVSRNNVGYWESGETTPTIENLYRIADACGVAVALLMKRPSEGVA